MKTVCSFWLAGVLSCLLAATWPLQAPAQVAVVGATAGSVPQLAFRQAEMSWIWNAGSFTQTATAAGSKGAISYSSSDPAVASVQAGSGLVTPLRQGEVTITAVQAPQGFFPLARASYRVRLAAGVPVLQPWVLPPVGLAGAPVTLTPPVSSSPGAFSFSSSAPAVASVVGNQLTVLGSGEAVITATQAATGDYTAATATARLLVNLQQPVVGPLVPPQGLVYGAAPSLLVAPSSDNPAPFVFSSSQPQVVEVSGSQLVVRGAGTAVITATQPAQGGFGGASVSATVQVAKAAPTLGLPADPLLRESRWQTSEIPMILGLTPGHMGTGGGTWSVADGVIVLSQAVNASGQPLVRVSTPGRYALRYSVPESANTLAGSIDVPMLAFANQPFQLVDATVNRPPSLPADTVIGSVTGVSSPPFGTPVVSLQVCIDRSTVYRLRFAVPNGEAFGVDWADPPATAITPTGGEVVIDLALGGNPADLEPSRVLRVRQLGSADGFYREVTRTLRIDATPVLCPSVPV